MLIPTGRRARPAPAASQRPVLTPPPPTIHRRGPVNEASTRGSNDFSRPVFPSPGAPGRNGNPFGLNLELRTPPTKSRTTHVEEGTGHRARAWNSTLNHIWVDPPIVRSLITCDLASHRLYGSRRCRDRFPDFAEPESKFRGGRFTPEQPSGQGAAALTLFEEAAVRFVAVVRGVEADTTLQARARFARQERSPRRLQRASGARYRGSPRRTA